MSISYIIRGLGFHVPETVLSNEDLCKIVDTSDEWITTRTGIKERRMAGPDTVCSDLALEAARAALDNAGMEAEELTHVIMATFTPDSPLPPGACSLAHKLSIKGRMAMDLSAACSGFLYSLSTARGLLTFDPEAKILVTASEVTTCRTNFKDRATCVLFGDGAGAAVVTAGNNGDGEASLVDVLVSSDGSLSQLLTVKGGGSATRYQVGQPVGEEFFVQMQGREVYKHAVRSMTDIALKILEKHGKSVEDVDVLLPHQANLRIIEAVGNKLGIPKEKVFVNVDRYGNTSAASVPLALAEARSTGYIKDGDLVLVSTFGAGFTWGSALLQF